MLSHDAREATHSTTHLVSQQTTNTGGVGEPSALDQVASELSLTGLLPRCCQQVHAAVALLLNGSLRVRPERFEARVSLPRGKADEVARILRLLTHGHIAIRHCGDTPDLRRLVVTGPAAALPLLGLPAGVERIAGGLPTEVALGKREHSAAAWRAALVTRGTLSETTRGLTISVPCSTTGKALALVAAARRCGAHASAKVGSDSIAVEVHGAVHGKSLLRALGVSEAALARLSNATNPTRVDNLDSANARRAREAAESSCARVRAALDVLSTCSVPEHLLEAAHLRLRYPSDSMTNLAERTLEPTTPTVLAGRIRRLLELARKHAVDSRGSVSRVDAPNRRTVLTAGRPQAATVVLVAG